jgi:hypothetical protein
MKTSSVPLPVLVINVSESYPHGSAKDLPPDPDPATGKYSEGKKPRLFFKQLKTKIDTEGRI